MGVLTQWCEECGWKDKTLHNEVGLCPKCNAPASTDNVLHFGDVEIRYDARLNKFRLCAPHSEEREIAEAGVPDVLRFILRHFRDWSGSIQTSPSEPKSSSDAQASDESVFDPEIYAAGAELSLMYIEAGARSYRMFSDVMLEALGPKIRPYLKSLYNGARDLPGCAPYRRYMTPHDDVR